MNVSDRFVFTRYTPVGLAGDKDVSDIVNPSTDGTVNGHGPFLT